jgi:uncharacterized protein
MGYTSYAMFAFAQRSATAKMRLAQLAEEIIGNLASAPQAELKINVEINADFPNGAPGQIK